MRDGMSRCSPAELGGLGHTDGAGAGRAKLCADAIAFDPNRVTIESGKR